MFLIKPEFTSLLTSVLKEKTSLLNENWGKKHFFWVTTANKSSLEQRRTRGTPCVRVYVWKFD